MDVRFVEDLKLCDGSASGLLFDSRFFMDIDGAWPLRRSRP